MGRAHSDYESQSPGAPCYLDRMRKTISASLVAKRREQYARDAAAEYDWRENIVSNPPSDVPGAPTRAAAGPLLIWSSRLLAVGDMFAHSPDVLCACPRPFVPGENPPPCGVRLRMLDVDGDGITVGGSAWMRE